MIEKYVTWVFTDVPGRATLKTFRGYHVNTDQARRWANISNNAHRYEIRQAADGQLVEAGTIQDLREMKPPRYTANVSGSAVGGP